MKSERSIAAGMLNNSKLWPHMRLVVVVVKMDLVTFLCGRFVVPEPGIRQLQIKQNHAKPTGNTGMAPFINDTWSTSESSNLGRVSSGGSVGAILCFLLFMLVRRLSMAGFFLQQQNNFSQSDAQQPLFYTFIFVCSFVRSFHS